MTKCLLKISNINMKIGNKKILKNVNLNIFQNQNIAISGANGSGKTTLLYIILKLLKPSSGSITWMNDLEVNTNQKIGVQFQTANFPIGFKVKDIVTFFRKIYCVNHNSDELFFLFEIDKLWNSEIKYLSGGENKRLNIYLALFHKPKIIFLDELSNELDLNKKALYIAFIKKYCQKNMITIVLISHDLNEIKMLCHKFYALEENTLILKKQIPRTIRN